LWKLERTFRESCPEAITSKFSSFVLLNRKGFFYTDPCDEILGLLDTLVYILSFEVYASFTVELFIWRSFPIHFGLI